MALLHPDKCIINSIQQHQQHVMHHLVLACLHLHLHPHLHVQRGQGQRHRMTPNDVQDADHASLAAGASQITSFIAAEPIPQYAFMFIVTGVAITCQLAGIGGAALLSPIFLLVFPLLGPDYLLQAAASAIACALLTECLIHVGLTGYWRRGLVDWGVAATGPPRASGRTR
jgi:hypothetical protein